MSHTGQSSRSAFADELRQRAAAHGAVQVDLQSILFQQGRTIARAYVDMMKSYAGLTAQSGSYARQDGKMLVSGFCRIEEEHFGKAPLLVRQKRTKSVLHATLSELREHVYTVQETDLFAAFCTSFAEFCTAEGIRTGKLSLLVRTKDGSRVIRELPAAVGAGEFAEALGFPYEIFF